MFSFLCRKKDGRIVVEACIIVPIVILTILALMYICYLGYQKTWLQAKVNNLAERGSAYWTNFYKDVETGKIALSDLNKEGLYWRIYDFNNGDKTKKLKLYSSENLKAEMDKHFTKKGVDNIETVSIELSNFAIYQKLKIKIDKTHNIPFGKFLKIFGLSEKFTLTASSDCILNEPAEFIRNTDFIVDIEKELEMKNPGFKNIVQKATDTINTIKEKLKMFSK